MVAAISKSARELVSLALRALKVDNYGLCNPLCRSGLDGPFWMYSTFRAILLPVILFY